MSLTGLSGRQPSPCSGKTRRNCSYRSLFAFWTILYRKLYSAESAFACVCFSGCLFGKSLSIWVFWHDWSLLKPLCSLLSKTLQALRSLFIINIFYSLSISNCFCALKLFLCFPSKSRGDNVWCRPLGTRFSRLYCPDYFPHVKDLLVCSFLPPLHLPALLAVQLCGA